MKLLSVNCHFFPVRCNYTPQKFVILNLLKSYAEQTWKSRKNSFLLYSVELDPEDDGITAFRSLSH
jgi:hypothetical protein